MADFGEMPLESPEALATKSSLLDRMADKRKRLQESPNLCQLFLEITQQCNERCLHCGSWCSPTSRSGLPVEKYAEVLDDVAEVFGSNKVQINITGGEPLVRPDFFDIVGEVNRRGFVWGMTTNGTLITPDVAHRLAESGMRTASISLDGMPESHDRMRGLQGSWKLAMDGTTALVEEGSFSHIQVTTVVNSWNIDELDELFDVVKGIDVDSWRVVGMEPIGRALEWPELQLSDDEQTRMMSFIADKRRQGYPVTYGCSHFLGLQLEGNLRSRLFLCHAGIQVASIDALGNIRACLDIEPAPETVFGNVEEVKFSDAWRDGFGIFRSDLSESSAHCQECEQSKWCAGGSHHTWDYAKNEQRMCFKGKFF